MSIVSKSTSTSEKDCHWHFTPQAGGQDVGPNNAMMQNFRSRPYSALVREAVQNSLDAVLDSSKPVEVEIMFSHINDRAFSNFFELKDHIEACGRSFYWIPEVVEYYSSLAETFTQGARNEIGYIRISDRNTKGMDYEPDSTQSKFYAFARSAGVSSKIGQESGGSFGFGKSAYFQISPIRTVFISSQTEKGQNVFEGVSWLCTHKIDEQKVSAVGYYDNNDGQPVTDIEKIPNRFQRKEPGTNFYIMGFDGNDKAEAVEEMIDEALRSFWLAIHMRHLIVKIGDEQITADNLETYMRRRFPSEVDDTAKGSLLKPRPYYMSVSMAGQSSKAQAFTERLPILGECTLYLIKAAVNKDKIVYMRRPLMLVFGKRTQTSYGVHGVFVCTNSDGDKILRNLENPAHDEWKASNWRDRRGRMDSTGGKALDEIQNFIQRCFAKLFANAEDTVLEITDLDDLLYVPEDLIDIEEDAKDRELGNPDGRTMESGESLTTELREDNGKLSDERDDTNIGSVRIVMPGSQSIDDETPLDDTDTVTVGIGGHRSRKSRTKGGKPTASNNFKDTQIVNPDGTYKMCLPVTFRVAAQNQDGKNYHILIIRCERDVIEGELEIITIGEQSDDVVELVYTDNGEIQGNSLTGVVLEHDQPNKIKILFKDNMRHAIKLKAYENQ